MPSADPSRPRHAIILAAGMGTRLRSVVADRPKGLLEIGGEPLVGRSIRLLREAGIGPITIVTGYAEEQYRRFAEPLPEVQLVVNAAFATTGSMASLALALERQVEPVLVLESDIVYEPLALTTLLDAPDPDATLVSGPTGAGDEVWVYAPGGRLMAMSKRREDLPAVIGELVGITRLSSAAAVAMLESFRRFVVLYGHGKMDYESDALVEVARTYSVATPLVPDLCWGEVDDASHLERVTSKVWPLLGRSR